MIKTIAIINLFIILKYIDASKTVPVNNFNENEVIHTEAGPISGLKAEDGNYKMYLGIPYAVVNPGNPFGLSTPYPKFEQTFEAIHDSVICPQVMLRGPIAGQIDCLQLNIYVPDTASTSNPLPVMVWVHGGAFNMGYASRELYGPKFLVKHDVILVTINYRVGVYGFMCLDTDEVPGNQGLKDQLTAVRWVKNNIKYFGGDPDKMTAIGQSAGSMSLHHHLLSPAGDYFDKYILQSGTGFTPDLIIDSDKEAPMKIAAHLGFNTSNIDEAISRLAATDPHIVVGAVTAMPDVSFWLCIEADHIEDRFVTDFPINQHVVSKVKGKAIMLGFTDDEGLSFVGIRTPAALAELSYMHDYLRDYFKFQPEQLTRTEEIVRNFYLGGKPQGAAVRAELSNFFADFIFVYPTHRCIKSFLENEVDKIYYFKFTYLGARNYIRWRIDINLSGGAAHADEVGYLFDVNGLPLDLSDEDQLMLERMTTMWTNFVKYGDPTPETNSLLPVKWEPITRSGTPYHFMKLDKELEMGTNPFHERISFWELLYDAYREYQRGYRVENEASSFNVSTKNYLALALLITFLNGFFSLIVN